MLIGHYGIQLKSPAGNPDRIETGISKDLGHLSDVVSKPYYTSITFLKAEVSSVAQAEVLHMQ